MWGKRRTVVALGRDGVEAVLQLLLVDVDGYVGVGKVVEAAGVIEVQVAHDDGFDVFDRLAALLDGTVEVVVGDVVDASENVVDRGASWVCEWTLLRCCGVSGLGVGRRVWWRVEKGEGRGERDVSQDQDASTHAASV